MPQLRDASRSPRRPSSRPDALALALALLSPLASRAEPPAVGAGTPRVRAAVDVTVLDLDVVATKDGRAVTDLGKDEVVVKVGGKRVAIDYFAPVAGGRIVASESALPAASFPAQASPAAPVETVVPRQLLVYFDDARLLPWQRRPIIEGLRGFVDRLGGADEAAVVSYDGTTNVLVPFSSSKEALLDGLSRLEKILPKGLQRERDFRMAAPAVELEARLQLERGSARGRPPDLRDSIVRKYAEEERARARRGLEELRRTVSGLAGRHGRRRMLFVTTGWERVPGQTLAQIAWGATTMRQFDTTLRRELDALLATANRSGVSVDVVDAKGFEGEHDIELAEKREVGAWVTRLNERDGMSLLAESTGGSFVETSNSYVSALEKVWRDASDYYSIGITLPGALPAGKVVKVDVSCTRPGVTVRTRTSVGARTDEETTLDLAEAALLSPPSAADFAARLALGRPRPEGLLSRRRLTPWQLWVPAAELTFAPDGDRETAVVEVTFAAVDAAGGRSELAPERHTVSVPALRLAEAQSREVPLSGGLRTRPGRHRIVATVRDVATGRTAIAMADLPDE